MRKLINLGAAAIFSLGAFLFVAQPVPAFAGEQCAVAPGTVNTVCTTKLFGGPPGADAIRGSILDAHGTYFAGSSITIAIHQCRGDNTHCSVVMREHRNPLDYPSGSDTHVYYACASWDQGGLHYGACTNPIVG
jgi:hypothetical protein